MFTVINPIRKKISAYLKYQEIRTENVIFRVHCLITALVLAVASIVLTSTQLIGDPISCFSDHKMHEKWHHAINTFCWVTSTFALPDFVHRQRLSLSPGHLLDLAQEINSQAQNRLYGLNMVGKSVVAPGVGNEYERGYDDDGAKKYYTYYQWVCFVLFFQAILCFIPKMLWERCEGGLLMKLAGGLHSGYCTSEEKEKKTNSIVAYLIQYKGRHKMYALMYWVCEALCLLNVVGQMWLINSFLGGDFWNFGSNVLKNWHLPQHERFDPMIYMFPRMTKCTFYYFGPSGSIVNLDSLCVLSQNVINEKVYVFLWFWFIFMAVALSILVAYRTAMVALPHLRPKLVQVRCRSSATELITATTERLDFGDWWIFYLLAKNINPQIFKDFLIEFAKKSNKVFAKNYPLLPYSKEAEALGHIQG